VQRDALEVYEAAELLAYPDHVVSGQWENALQEAIKRGELPAHYRDAPLWVHRYIAPMTEEQARRTEPTLHILREDLHRFLVKRGIASPYADLPGFASEPDTAAVREHCQMLYDQGLKGRALDKRAAQHFNRSPRWVREQRAGHRFTRRK
jgi:hypothetical protein